MNISLNGFNKKPCLALQNCLHNVLLCKYIILSVVAALTVVINAEKNPFLVLSGKYLLTFAFCP